MVLGGELAAVQALFGHLLEALCHHLGNEAVGLDEADLDVAVAVAVQTELQGNMLGQRLEELGVGRRQVGVHLLQLLDLLELGDFVAVFGKDVVEFLDELLHGGDELDEALGDKDGAEVPAYLGTLGDEVGDLADDVVESHALGLHLLGDDADVGLCL